MKRDLEKQRAWQRRSKPLKRSGFRGGRKPIKKSNPERRRRAYDRNFGERADHIRAMPCLVAAAWSPPQWTEAGAPRCFGDVQACHARARGMGGVKGDRRTLVPLCAAHHRESGELNTTERAEFEARYQIDLTAKAAALAIVFDGLGVP